MAGGTDGNIISFDASGDPVAIATGSDGQVLTSTGAGSPPAFESPAAGGVEADTVMIFFQSAAPTGWTKLTSQNDKTLRVVSGSGGGTGGDWAMTAGETSSATTIAVSTMPAHTHTAFTSLTTANGGWNAGYGNGSKPATGNSSSTGGGGSHTHTIAAPQYIDVIICDKD